MTSHVLLMAVPSWFLLKSLKTLCQGIWQEDIYSSILRFVDKVLVWS